MPSANVVSHIPAKKRLMKNKILAQLKMFRVPLIILGVLAVLLVILGIVVPSVQTAIANSTPVVSITAENDKVYRRDGQISPEDFEVTAVHENGGKSKLSADEYKINRKSLRPIGKTTEVTITYSANESIQCKVKVQVDREAVVGFQVGYPEISDVTAVLYSNGELCFEGEGDVLVCNEGEYPWQDYEDMDEHPILSVSFEDGVTPTNMNYWFEGNETLSYVQPVPKSVQSMERTFAECTALEEAVDWSACTNLYNIDEVYADCTALTDAVPLTPSISSAYRAYAGCTSLVVCSDSTAASGLLNASEMYAGCSNLGSAQVGPSVENMSGMFMDCINLRQMPEIPSTVQDMSSAFANCVVLGASDSDGGEANLLTSIPESVQNIKNAFANCQLLQGELSINCNAAEYSGVFSSETCKSTQVNLTGSSKLLDVYANTNEYQNVFVNGKSPDPSLTRYADVISEEPDTEPAGDREYKESNTVDRNIEGSGGESAE